MRKLVMIFMLMFLIYVPEASAESPKQYEISSFTAVKTNDGVSSISIAKDGDENIAILRCEDQTLLMVRSKDSSKLGLFAKSFIDNTKGLNKFNIDRLIASNSELVEGYSSIQSGAIPYKDFLNTKLGKSVHNMQSFTSNVPITIQKEDANGVSILTIEAIEGKSAFLNKIMFKEVK